MSSLCSIIDASLFIFFLFIAIIDPIFVAQLALPPTIFPDFLVDFKNWIVREFDHYLYIEKPNFYIGIVWLVLVFLWPLSLINVYAIFTKKAWFNTACLIYGVSFSTALVAAVCELVRSNRASEKLLMMYYLFMGFGVLAILRGLVPASSKTTSTNGKRPAVLPRKKKA